jgi:trehalose 6-phosphate phosphatase
MDSILATGVLERIASADLLLALDFDGTLAPIVDDPAQAVMRGSTRRLLAQAAQAYPCAVISGRPEEDVLRLLAGVTVWYVLGNRGLQTAEQVDRLAAEAGRWRALISQDLQTMAGVAVEDKGVSLAIHYRHAADHDGARAAILEAARKIPGARIIEGKQVVNLLPAGGPDKGIAVDGLRSRIRAQTTLYVGDDRTDEPVFALDGGMIGVRIGPAKEPSAARYCLKDQTQIDDLLEQLVELRPTLRLRPEAQWRPTPRKYE